MRAAENQPSFLGRISIRRNQVTAMDGSHEQDLQDLEHFQKNVADRFADLLSPPPEDSTPTDSLLSISWLRKLLDVFLCCEAEFKAVLIMGRDPCQLSKPPLDKLITDLLERTVKVLDICNAVSSGVDSVRQYQKLGEIVVSAFEQRPIGDGQVKRAKKALTGLLSTMSGDDKENSHCKTAERSWSFNKRGGISSAGKDRAPVQSLSMIVARNWSSSKQIHAMCSNLVAPRGGESSGLASPLYLMGVVMVFVMWALVAAIPCQDRNGLSMHVQLPRNLGCVQSIITLHEKIAEEWKKKEKKGSAGVLEEIQRMEKLGQSLIEFADSFQYPAEKEKEEEVIRQAVELAEICRRMDEGLVPLQQQLRELFHRVIRSRGEVFETLEHASKLSQPTM